MTFDPNAAAAADSGVFGLPSTEADARVILLPVPFDVTTSYGKGTAGGPAAILEASRQVDLFDLDTGRPYEAGVFMLDEHPDVRRWNETGNALSAKVIEACGVVEGDASLEAALREVNAIGAQLNDHVHAEARRLLDAGKIVGLVGGDHATPFGAIRAHAERFAELSVLHFDAHADLRPAYEGFTWSHASIMHNVLGHTPVARLVQVGIRDFSEEEYDAVGRSNGRVVSFYDADLKRAQRNGQPFDDVAAQIAGALTAQVYVSFDIDGLDPALCPHTGTPVPGGLAFHEACAILEAVVRSGRRIVGFDLNEVAPGPDGDEWDANVGARVLYKLIGWTLVSQGLARPRR